MGNKIAAKSAVSAYDIPLVPGTAEPLTDKTKAAEIAKEIGFPVLIKAAAGGGGKGMRIVHEESEILDQVDRAVSEAQSAFGDGAVFIEKYVTSPRHIEIQILADKHGHIIHLNERECSVQRRHQKVVEEAPSPLMTTDLRARMGADAVNVAKSCNYVGAGTVEVIMDEQIKIAEGRHLEIQQEDVKCEGHAIELRVYAEDPTQGFIPSIGHLSTYQPPKESDTIRVDDGYREGMDVPIYYDPMLSKLIAYAPSRNTAISLMKAAINDYHIEGISTTLSFGTFVCDHPSFVSGKYDTHFVKKFYNTDLESDEPNKIEEALAKIGLKAYLDAGEKLSTPQIVASNWTKR